jgi:hypothetical protein
MEDVPLSAASGNEVCAEFPAEVGDMDIDQVGEAVFVFVKQVFVDLSSRDNFAAMEGEEFEERVFAGGERERSLNSGYGFGIQVDGELSNADDGGWFAGRASDERAEACAEFGKVKGFGEVVVCAAVEAADTIVDLVAGREDQDGNSVGFAELLQEFPAVEFGKQQIQDNGIIRPGARFVESFFTVGGLIDGISVFAQHLSDGAEEIRFVFDHEDTHGFLGEERSGKWEVCSGQWGYG